MRSDWCCRFGEGGGDDGVLNCVNYNKWNVGLDKEGTS
jgi:hypothetical protein